MPASTKYLTLQHEKERKYNSNKTTKKGRKTWFGYFKNDGFEKRKHKGRIDARAKWKNIKKQWVDSFLDKDEVSGLSVKQEVKAADEWCAEAYMETDYSQLTQADFMRKMNDYIAFKFLNGVDE